MAPRGDHSSNAPSVPQQVLAQAAAAVAGNEEDEQRSSGATHASRNAPTVTVDHHDVYNDAPPAYGDIYGNIESEDSGFGTKATVSSDGRVNIRIDQRTRSLSNLLVPALRNQLEAQGREPAPPPYIPASLGGEPGQIPPPPLNVAIHVVGSRGDVQPFIALGKVLKDRYGHRVRLATHPVFKDFVTENGLEFFSIGGDPAELMAFMVKNPGLMPGFDTLRSGDVGKRRKEIATMVKGCWRSCIEAGDGTGTEATDNTTEDWMSNSGDDAPRMNPEDKPFVADAIIANPPSFAHIHCAEKLGCPLHIMFTMPYSPTQAFPHPLANIQSTNADPNLTNFMTYALVDMMTWQGLGDIINRFRMKSLNLDPISLMWAPGMLQRLRVPHTYCWSAALIPKPKDWGNHISISGFYFLSLASNYTPDPDLKAFLDAGPPPVYIGFGSIVVDDPNAMTKMIFDAVKKTGQRALVSKGWGGLGADQLGIPEGVFMLGNVPHDWLFNHVSCVVHHGGAGTTAAGISCGKPTVVVPFFGDQAFWGAMVAKAGAGPTPIAYKDLTADSLAESITTALKPASLDRAKELSNRISKEKGSESGAQTFHQFLELDNLRCNLAPSRAAVWRLKRTDVRLSALAATTLGNEGLLDFKDLKLYRAREYDTEDGPWDPISGGASALVGTMGTMMMGVADFPVEALKALRIHPDAAKKKPEQSQGSSSNGTTPANPSDVPTEGTETPPSDSSTSLVRSPGSGQFNLGESLQKMNSPIGDGTPSPGTTRTNSMGTALREQLSHHRSGSGNGRREDASPGGSRARSPAGPPDLSQHLNTALGTSKGVSRIVGAGFKSPMDFTMGLAQGFHNAPRLYGDETVRKKEQVTDFRSGVRAATKEFGFGMYDGITGLVTQPMSGAKKEGFAGFLKGFGKGIGGIALKPGAAIFGIPAYLTKGVYRELQAHIGSSVSNYIIAARTAQGFEEWHRSSPGERADIIQRWKTLQKDLKKKKTAADYVQDAFKDKKNRPNTQPSRASNAAEGTNDDSDPDISVPGEPAHNAHGHQQAHSATSAEDAELEEAIRQSVAQTSNGNPEEDEMIERAIRASVAELQNSDGLPPAGAAGSQQPHLDAGPLHLEEDDDEEENGAIERAMQASMAEAQRYTRGTGQGVGGGEDDDEELQRALKESMQGHKGKATASRGHTTDSEWDDSDDGGHTLQQKKPHLDKLAAEQQYGQETGTTSARRGISLIENDKAPDVNTHETGEQDDEELKRAMQESARHADDENKQRTEEEVVLEYVKKQSLIEEEHRRKLMSGGGGTTARGTGESSAGGSGGNGGTSTGRADEQDAEDEELKRAMEMSRTAQ